MWNRLIAGLSHSADLQPRVEEGIDEVGQFTAPPAGEWTAEQLLAHIVGADTGITSVALGVASGQRLSYDNRYSSTPGTSP